MATQQVDGTRQVKPLSITGASVAANTIPNSKLTPFIQNQDFGGFKGVNVGAPTQASDLANKSYVDTVATGLSVKASVHVASTANIAGTYANTGGAAARGQFTAMPLTVDGLALVAGNRVLLKNQTSGDQNGIWVVTTPGTGANGVWDRATDFDADSKVSEGNFVMSDVGTVNGHTGWVLTTANPIILGGASGTVLVFSQFSAADYITAGNGLNRIGNVVNVVPGDNSLTAAGASLVANIDGVTLETTTNLHVKANGIAPTHLSATVAGAGIGGGGGAALTIRWSGVEVLGGVPNAILTNFTIAANPMGASATDASAVAVYVNGALQIPVTHYTRSGTTITFVDPPATGDSILGIYFKA